MKRSAGIVGLILAAVFLILGFVSTTPDKYIRSYGSEAMHEYVGGDAYNFIIEAALRGGEISGAKTSRAIYFATAGILLVLSLSFLKAEKGEEETRGKIADAKDAVRNVEKAVDKLRGTVSENQEKTDAALRKIIEQQAGPAREGPGDGEN